MFINLLNYQQISGSVHTNKKTSTSNASRQPGALDQARSQDIHVIIPSRYAVVLFGKRPQYLKGLPLSFLSFIPNMHRSLTETRMYTMSHKILRLNEVKALTGLSRSTIYLEISKGTFPKQIKLTGNRSVGWHENSITQWIESRQQA